MQFGLGIRNDRRSPFSPSSQLLHRKNREIKRSGNVLGIPQSERSEQQERFCMTQEQIYFFGHKRTE